MELVTDTLAKLHKIFFMFQNILSMFFFGGGLSGRVRQECKFFLRATYLFCAKNIFKVYITSNPRVLPHIKKFFFVFVEPLRQGSISTSTEHNRQTYFISFLNFFVMRFWAFFYIIEKN